MACGKLRDAHIACREATCLLGGPGACSPVKFWKFSTSQTQFPALWGIFSVLFVHVKLGQSLK